MDFLSLNIFPSGGLASSVITTVWIGVTVVVFLNLRFGTTLSGLVVPGYLVPLFLVKPTSAWIIILESVVTYFIARLIAERGMIKIGLSEFFGRDRFFVLILISVLVRISFDGFLLPVVADYLLESGVNIEVRSGLHSFGLVIIALCANQFWNSGFRYGSMTLAVYILLTLLIVRFVLMQFTNFNISTLSYLYEDISSNILASPKAYIILITAAFVASRMNLKYGWDFNGILIPSLLALQWYDPLKILTTFIEAFVILYLAKSLLKLSIFKHMNIEGARELFLFFNIGFAYKLVLGYAIIAWFPETKITDYYGFGYLLGTLIAIKMYQKNIAARITRTTIETSFVSVLIASVIGFGLTLTTSNELRFEDNLSKEKPVLQSEKSFLVFINEIRKESYQSEKVEEPYPVPVFDIQTFKKIFGSLSTLTETNISVRLGELSEKARKIHYLVTLVENRYLVFHDAIPKRGWGIFVCDIQASTSLSIEVPRALDESGVADVAAPFYQALNAKYLSFSGARSKRAIDGSDDALVNPQSLFQLFHQTVSSHNTLQLRGYNALNVRKLFGVRNDSSTMNNIELEPTIWVKRSLPVDLSLKQLKRLLEGFKLNWRESPITNIQRATSVKGFSELFLSEKSVISILSNINIKELDGVVKLDEYSDSQLTQFIDQQLNQYAPRGSQQYAQAERYELLYFERAILKPILQMIDSPNRRGLKNQINLISLQASQFGYLVAMTRSVKDMEPLVVLFENPSVLKKRYWGTYVFRLNEVSPLIIEAPMAMSEKNTAKIAMDLFVDMKAKVLLVSGTHPFANSDGSSRLTATQNRESLFNLVHQTTQSHYWQNHPHVIQVRGERNERNPHKRSVTLLHLELQKTKAQRLDAFEKIETQLKQLGYDIDTPSKQLAEVRKEVRLNAQSRFSRYISNAHYTEMWVPLLLRREFEIKSDNNFIAEHLTALGQEIYIEEIEGWLSKQRYSPLTGETLSIIKEQIIHYVTTQNIVQLQALLGINSVKRIALMTHPKQSHSYFVIYDDSGHVLLVANLSYVLDKERQTTTLNQTSKENIDAFLLGKYVWFYRGGDK